MTDAREAARALADGCARQGHYRHYHWACVECIAAALAAAPRGVGDAGLRADVSAILDKLDTLAPLSLPPTRMVYVSKADIATLRAALAATPAPPQEMCPPLTDCGGCQGQCLSEAPEGPVGEGQG